MGFYGHQSTGYSPHFLLFGKAPYLPLDVMLGREEDIGVQEEVNDWVLGHQQRLQVAYEQAGRKLEQAAEARRKYAGPPARKCLRAGAASVCV